MTPAKRSKPTANTFYKPGSKPPTWVRQLAKEHGMSLRWFEGLEKKELTERSILEMKVWDALDKAGWEVHDICDSLGEQRVFVAVHRPEPTTAQEKIVALRELSPRSADLADVFVDAMMARERKRNNDRLQREGEHRS